ncbi:MAG: methylenetetrahydrofolate reductase [Gammaproteobacteria bacterium]|nr:methylenetetrahydrofolate reductase [Gammaproteobacteria bacterium]
MKTFRDAVRHKDFAIAAEIFLRPETDAAGIRAQADILKEHVDGILLTDNQYGRLHLSTVAAASILLAHGVDPVVQLSSRNRNRIALLSDLLGAAAIGVSSLLLVAGEKAPAEFKPRPKPVLDLNALDLIRTANVVNGDESLPRSPDFLIGGVVTPMLPGPKWKAKGVLDKIGAGAHFLQTHLCMDLDILRPWLKELVARKLIQRTSVIGAVAVIESTEDAEWILENRHNAMLPVGVIDRLRRTRDPRSEGIAICAETIREMRGIPGLAGVSIMASRDLSVIPEVIAAAGLND